MMKIATDNEMTFSTTSKSVAKHKKLRLIFR